LIIFKAPLGKLRVLNVASTFNAHAYRMESLGHQPSQRWNSQVPLLIAF
jgi:hypothetical protein